MRQSDTEEDHMRREQLDHIMEKCQEKERNIGGVNMVSSLIQDSFFFDYKELIPQRISTWDEYGHPVVYDSFGRK